MRRADIEVPNLPVAMNAWERLACYPQSTFYPLSNGHSTLYRGITKPYFRICSTCLSRSEAPLCLYALRAITNRAEGTIGCLRYLLGGDRPSQTDHQTRSRILLKGPRLDLKPDKGGISRMAPRQLASPLQSLPPILHMPGLKTMSKYSEGSWGLTVQVRGVGIFTDNAISPSPRRRQCRSRYTIRAGRNLPDKEFRYLRTVIVTAAVYWGFDSRLRLR